MARGIPNLLTSHAPYGTAPAEITIGHVQLRDILICPHEKGVVYYPQSRMIVEHELTTNTTDNVTELGFIPNSLSSLHLPTTNETLLAAGGQEAELHLSLYSPPTSPRWLRSDDTPIPHSSRGFGRQRWHSEVTLDPPASINNSVHLSSLSLSGSHESSVEPRMVISNNDKTVKFYDVAVRVGRGNESTIHTRLSNSDGTVQRLSLAGQLRLDVPVNHSSISPDGRTLLSVGDSPDIYLHRIAGGSRITFSPMSKMSLSSHINAPPFINYSNTTVAASFSTAFSANGSKFAVASQEGVVVVWDVRSTKPLKVIQTDKTRRNDRNGNGGASGWLFDSPWDWSRGIANAPGWGVRSVKFSPTGVGKEIMTFTEHTSLLHVVDARTFETEEIVRVPNFDASPPPRTSTVRPRSRSSSPMVRAASASPARDTFPTPLSLPPPPRILLFNNSVNTVEEAFRIPISESNSRRRRHTRRIRGTRDDGANTATDEDPDVDGIVVIPPLGDAEVEDDVRRLLGRRTSHARTRSIFQTPTYSAQDDPRTDPDDEREREREREDEMEVDDFEADCLSSHTPSRASSPALPAAPSTSAPAVTITTTTTTTTTGPSTRLPMPSHIIDHFRLSRPSLLSNRREATSPYISHRPTISRSSSSFGSRRFRRRSTQREDNDNEDGNSGNGSGANLGNTSTSSASVSPSEVELDLAGMCYDPTGEFVYVAATKGVCAWKIRGAEKSWWIDSVLA